ncbi:hypothetical protein FQN49_007803, partial [Arthroderma sp. PD_2]
RAPESFVSLEKDERDECGVIYDICLKVAASKEVKNRVLVSLYETNEVAKRLEERIKDHGDLPDDDSDA